MRQVQCLLPNKNGSWCNLGATRARKAQIAGKTVADLVKNRLEISSKRGKTRLFYGGRLTSNQWHQVFLDCF